MEHVTEDWEFEQWGVCSCMLTHPILLSEEENKRYGILLYFKVAMLKVLLSDKIFFNVGINLARSRGGGISVYCSFFVFLTSAFSSSDHFWFISSLQP